MFIVVTRHFDILARKTLSSASHRENWYQDVHLNSTLNIFFQAYFSETGLFQVEVIFEGVLIYCTWRSLQIEVQPEKVPILS